MSRHRGSIEQSDIVRHLPVSCIRNPLQHENGFTPTGLPRVFYSFAGLEPEGSGE